MVAATETGFTFLKANVCIYNYFYSMKRSYQSNTVVELKVQL